jgi:hypothetical protein
MEWVMMSTLAAPVAALISLTRVRTAWATVALDWVLLKV